MAEMNDIVKLAVDAYRGNVEKYSTNQSMDTLRQALVDLNGGSTMLDYKKIRDGECVEGKSVFLEYQAGKIIVALCLYSRRKGRIGVVFVKLIERAKFRYKLYSSLFANARNTGDVVGGVSHKSL